MTKLTISSMLILLTLFIICTSALTHAARPVPQLGGAQETREMAAKDGKKANDNDDLCNGVEDDECRMMRRELVAHLDYIYTQKKKN